MLTKNERAAFFEHIGKLKGGDVYTKTAGGDFIIPVGNEFGINNKLVYTDGNYLNPKIKKVISINLGNETDIDFVRRYILDNSKEQSSLPFEIINDVFRENIISEYTAEDSPSYKELGQSGRKSKTAYSFDTGLQNGSGSIGANQNNELRADNQSAFLLPKEVQDVVFNDEYYSQFKNDDKTPITESIEELQAHLEEIEAKYTDKDWDERFATVSKIKALKAGYKSQYDYFVGIDKDRIIKDYKYDPQKYQKLVDDNNDKVRQQEVLREEIKAATPLKRAQYNIIQKTNPAPEGSKYVWIRSPKDIKSFQEAISDGESFVWGDYSKDDAQRDLKRGKVVVYSSYPIKNGVFVSTSRQQAEDYAGGAGNRVYSKEVSPHYVAWINGDEGQYANTGLKVDTEYSASLGDYEGYLNKYYAPDGTGKSIPEIRAKQRKETVINNNADEQSAFSVGENTDASQTTEDTQQTDADDELDRQITGSLNAKASPTQSARMAATSAEAPIEDIAKASGNRKPDTYPISGGCLFFSAETRGFHSLLILSSARAYFVRNTLPYIAEVYHVI